MFRKYADGAGVHDLSGISFLTSKTRGIIHPSHCSPRDCIKVGGGTCPKFIREGFRLRVVALGRKNYLFAGSDAGGEHAAAIYSLLGSAKLNDLDPELYLRYVLERIADHPVVGLHSNPGILLFGLIYCT
jgi:hypothetical protein